MDINLVKMHLQHPGNGNSEPTVVSIRRAEEARFAATFKPVGFFQSSTGEDGGRNQQPHAAAFGLFTTHGSRDQAPRDPKAGGYVVSLVKGTFIVEAAFEPGAIADSFEIVRSGGKSVRRAIPNGIADRLMTMFPSLGEEIERAAPTRTNIASGRPPAAASQAESCAPRP